MAGRVSDWYFSNGKDFDGITEQIDEVSAEAARHDRRVRFGLNGFLIARDTAAEAKEVLREIVSKADVDAVGGHAHLDSSVDTPAFRRGRKRTARVAGQGKAFRRQADRR